MKQRIIVIFSILGLIIISTSNADAAYKIKKSHAQAIENQFSVAPISTPIINSRETNTDVTAIKHLHQKRSLISCIVNYLLPHDEALIPLPVYIILAFPFLGWLAMGINDDFTGDDWWICLILYCCFWLPGFVFTLLKMRKYYPVHELIEGKSKHK